MHTTSTPTALHCFLYRHPTHIFTTDAFADSKMPSGSWVKVLFPSSLPNVKSKQGGRKKRGRGGRGGSGGGRASDAFDLKSVLKVHKSRYFHGDVAELPVQYRMLWCSHQDHGNESTWSFNLIFLFNKGMDGVGATTRKCSSSSPRIT